MDTVGGDTSGGRSGTFGVVGGAGLGVRTRVVVAAADRVGAVLVGAPAVLAAGVGLRLGSAGTTVMAGAAASGAG
ncbi:hypothetical protein, partial [Micromonospora sp.]|uniref:hypothetical protein n=1 Tax=Micromonospora sp. TaxID=1876 RepID=UPI003B3A0851